MINIIVAVSLNGVIGKDGKMPWHIEGELEQFRNLTTGNVVIMGRRTYESIGHPLPGRINAILSNTRDYEGENLKTFHSLKEALDEYCDKEIYIAGGYNVYEEAIPLADRIYLTLVKREVKGDVYFPGFNKEDYEASVLEEKSEYTRYLYTRKAKE